MRHNHKILYRIPNFHMRHNIIYKTITEKLQIWKDSLFLPTVMKPIKAKDVWNSSFLHNNMYLYTMFSFSTHDRW